LVFRIFPAFVEKRKSNTLRIDGGRERRFAAEIALEIEMAYFQANHCRTPG
jgi:hypothetical protein